MFNSIIDLYTEKVKHIYYICQYAITMTRLFYIIYLINIIMNIICGCGAVFVSGI